MIPELDPDPEREPPNEWTTVERPLLQQLVAMGWEYLPGDIDYPQKICRENFRDVLLREPLRQAIIRINATEDGVTIPRANSGDTPHSREVTVKFIDFDPASLAKRRAADVLRG